LNKEFIMRNYSDSLNPSAPITYDSVGKVYGLLALTLLVSAVASYFGMFWAFAYQHPIILMLITFGLLFAVQYAGRRNSPMAVPLVFLFAAGMGAFMGPMISSYLKAPGGALVISEAFGTTFVMFISLSIYATLTKRNFSHIGGFLMAGLVTAIVASLVNMFFIHMATLQLAIAGVIVLVFSGLIVFDTQRLMRGGATSPSLVVVSL
jgi:modulator of FtsH protease